MVLCIVKSMMYLIAKRAFGRNFLLLGTSDALHGFMTDELNDHFAGISISPHEIYRASNNKYINSPLEGFPLQPVI